MPCFSAWAILPNLGLLSLLSSVAAHAFIEPIDQDDGVSLLQLHSQRAPRRRAEPSDGSGPCTWRDGASSGEGAHEHMVGYARDESHCLTMVLDASACPLANAASLEGSGACFCQFKMAGVTDVKGWRTCVLEQPKEAEEADDCSGGWRLGATEPVRQRLHIGTVSKRADCVAMGMVQCPDASGVSLPSQSQGGCFCEYGDAIAERSDLQTCIFATSPAIKTSKTTTTTGAEMVSGGAYGMFSRPVIPFPPPPLSACMSELLLTKVVQNNLGGHGPEQGAHVLRYGNVSTVDCARSVDLIVEAKGDSYNGGEPKRNGLIGLLGRISMKSGGSAMLKFSFVDSATDEPVELANFIFSVLGLDQVEEGKVRASVVAEGYAAYYLHQDSEISVGGGPEGADKSAIFTSTRPHLPEDDIYSPKRAVDFHFQDTSEFTLQLSLTEGVSDRNFHFGGSSAVACSSDEVEECIGGWQSGDGESCHEQQVNADMNMGQCAKTVKERHPLANAASVDETTRACFAHFKMTGAGESRGSRKTCAFPRVPQARTVSLSQVSEACSDGWQLGGGNGKLKSGLNSRTYVGAASDPDECVAAVKKTCPGATGATLPTRSAGGCYCEFGSGRDQRADLQSCLFSGSRSATLVAGPSPAAVGPSYHPRMDLGPVAQVAPANLVAALPVAPRAPGSAPAGQLVPSPTTPAASGVPFHTGSMTLDSLFSTRQPHALSLLETAEIERLCPAKADVVLLLDASTDGSGGGASGASAAAQDFLRGVRGDDVRVAALRFRRPGWREVMEKRCPRKEDAAEPCKAEWLSHLAADAGSVASAVAGASDESAFASTATALRMAREELDDGREEAQKILVVISDGLAQDAPETAEIALHIKANARLVFVPATRRGALSHHTLKLFAAGKGGDGSMSLDNSEALDEEVVARLLGQGCVGGGKDADKERQQRNLPWQRGSAAVLATAPQGSLDKPALEASETTPPLVIALSSSPPLNVLQSAGGNREVNGQTERDSLWGEMTR